MRASKSSLVLALIVTALASPTHAADSAKAQKAEVRRLLQEQRKLAQDKTNLETKLKDADAKLEDTLQGLAQAKGHGATLARKLRAADEESTQLKAKLQEMEHRLADQTDARLKAEGEGKRLSAALDNQEKETSICEEKNLQLYRYGQDMALRYQNKTAADALEQSEPFTGLKRVEIENLLEEYRDKLDSQKIEPTAGRTAVSDQNN